MHLVRRNENLMKMYSYVYASYKYRGIYFVRLLQMEVTSLADVYWFDDNVAARTTFGKDLPRWLQARQTLPTSKENLETLKADLWSAVVKNSQHQDAWTWGTNLPRFVLPFSHLFSLETRNEILLSPVRACAAPRGFATVAAISQRRTAMIRS